ncbi:hypothetical protein D3C76_816350 [compost metagenome]
MPEQVDVDLRQLDRVGQGDQVEGFDAGVGEALRHGGQQVGSLEDVAYRDEVRDFEADVAFDAESGHVRVHLAVPGGGGDHPHMTIGAEALQG